MVWIYRLAPPCFLGRLVFLVLALFRHPVFEEDEKKEQTKHDEIKQDTKVNLEDTTNIKNLLNEITNIESDSTKEEKQNEIVTSQEPIKKEEPSSSSYTDDLINLINQGFFE